MLKMILLFSLIVIQAHSISPPKCRTAVAKDRVTTYLQTGNAPGPIPEFLKVKSVLLAYFFRLDYFVQMHTEIVKNLPKEVTAETFVASGDRAINPFGAFATQSYLSSMKKYIESKKLKVTEVSTAEDYHPGSHGNWIRDFMSPLAVTKDGQIAFVNVNYFRSAADKTDYEARKILTQRILEDHGIDVIMLEMPFVFEWGNWENDGRGNFFVSKAVIDRNKNTPGFLEYKDGKVINAFEVWMKKQFGEKTNVVWNDPLPFEATGHNDLMFKFLNSQTVVLAHSSHKENQKVLDQVAKKFVDMGKKVLRSPLAETQDELKMELPIYSVRSYTNSLIVNGVAFVPKYGNGDGTFERFDLEAKALYESQGFKVHFVPSQDSIADKGAVHCVACTLPNLDAIF